MWGDLGEESAQEVVWPFIQLGFLNLAMVVTGAFVARSVVLARDTLTEAGRTALQSEREKLAL